ncbi:MAG: cell division protein FtsQ/DivIB [Actinomycetota bacterium]
MSEARRVATDPRFSRRRKSVARSRRKATFVRLSVLLAVAFAVWAAFFSPLLAVRNVRVVGARHVSSADVARVAHLDESDNLLLVSPTEIAERVQTLPWVKSVDVDRALPGTVRVKIVERKPALALSLGAARWTIDARGRVLKSGARSSLPTLAGAEVSGVEPGARLTTPEFSGALKTFRSMPRSLRARLGAIFVPSAERITLSLKDGTQIRYGAARQLKAKHEVLKALLARLVARGASAAYIDVRVPANPAVSGVPASPETESAAPPAAPSESSPRPVHEGADNDDGH